MYDTDKCQFYYIKGDSKYILIHIFNIKNNKMFSKLSIYKPSYVLEHFSIKKMHQLQPSIKVSQNDENITFQKLNIYMKIPLS